MNKGDGLWKSAGVRSMLSVHSIYLRRKCPIRLRSKFLHLRAHVLVNGLIAVICNFIYCNSRNGHLSCVVGKVGGLG